MTPVSPVLPSDEQIIGYDVWPGASRLLEITFAANQPQYTPLPALRSIDGVVTSRWQLTWWERFRVLVTGDLWIQQLTCGAPLQPIKPRADEPKAEECI